MYKELLTRFPLIDLVVTGQLLFFAVFVGALFWIFRRGSSDFYERLANLPMDSKGDSHE